MTAIDLGDADGYATVRVGDVEVRVDLVEAHSRLIDHHNSALKAGEADYWPGVLAVMESLGLPRCSWHGAARFQKGVFEAVEGLKKKDTPSAGSPGTTESTPGG